MVSHQSIHSSDTPFSCPQCSYRGKTKKYLSRHIRQVHEETPETHKCSFCGKFFLHQSGLKVHEMVHTGLQNSLEAELTKTEETYDFVTTRVLLRNGSIFYKEPPKLIGTFKGDITT
ncbi:Uncharacterized protein OBRU01_04341 [Operophtera brumata]|uniref:C2H2-type domain-containing protein n=1 Tax=Operophtera brumata TaxID=104452 RepID=A0A0L7L8Z7_OPEBR|nr:Uncharacterized protein OBRU01_04341 [Operophtera brumata]